VLEKKDAAWIVGFFSCLLLKREPGFKSHFIASTNGKDAVALPTPRFRNKAVTRGSGMKLVGTPSQPPTQSSGRPGRIYVEKPLKSRQTWQENERERGIK
jgi:hypothetical protein